jgi:3-phenylpropionate/trans-cinnamate dioxygenase ferredoxin subunit
MAGDPTRICAVDDLAEGGIKPFEVEGIQFLLARRGDRIYALENCCSHDGAQLSDGDLVDGQIQCARHGGRFDLSTGEATQMPAIAGIGSFRVEMNNGDIYIYLKE